MPPRGPAADRLPVAAEDREEGEASPGSSQKSPSVAATVRSAATGRGSVLLLLLPKRLSALGADGQVGQWRVPGLERESGQDGVHIPCCRHWLELTHRSGGPSTLVSS